MTKNALAPSTEWGHLLCVSAFLIFIQHCSSVKNPVYLLWRCNISPPSSTLFSRKTPEIPPFLGEIYSKPTINDTKVGVKYRFGHWIGDAIGGVVFAILGINRSPLPEKSERSRWYTSVPCRRGYHLKPPYKGVDLWHILTTAQYKSLPKPPMQAPAFQARTANW